ncbi:8-oxo-dGTP pyrophosphatase MutT, NUDIX family [Actinopolyspora mzabensis]|uniref:8-oxo-dGTP pyrophosphatase MutT, NUDIX family n=1 Tax=Actinopolyspora mzabensis TaxID=995066 RepID=A0A1G8XQA0_ACTMZ|nr:NUDIX hydrolase [Actinopolyspora mzabensis]SDJ92708.1 8-oxo-dGTP pyrophosphatase MutT, NUDIX family [Actinopolyspora mzabensis]
MTQQRTSQPAVRIQRRSARAILIDDEERLVLLRRTKPGMAPYWTTPGGGLEHGDESLEAAMHREIAEEMGATASGAKSVFLSSTARSGGLTVQHFFVARLTSMDESTRHGPEFEEPTRGEYRAERFDMRAETLATLDLRPAPLREFVLSNRLALLAEALYAD